MTAPNFRGGFFMPQFDLTILGSGAALPARNRYPSAQVLNANGSLYLIDCGEGTQMRLRSCGIRIQHINDIFISHLHGDHYLGLVGLISTMHLLGREKELRIHGPKGIQALIDLQLELSGTFLRYPLNVHVISTEDDLIYEDNKLTVHCLPLKHRIECHGFLFKEKERVRNIKKECIQQFGLSIPNILDLKAGKSIVTDSGLEVMNIQVTEATTPARSYAYCSDTAFNEALIPPLKNCDLLYHEATFADEHIKRAKKTFHSTARQAATLAREAGVSKLLIGHFSSRYKRLEVLLAQAQEVFPNTELAEEGITFRIGG